MAGMLPGVEAARRRRCHQNSNLLHSSPTISGRRSSFSLYAKTHDFHFSTSNSFTRSYVLCDESGLGAEAREAKKRLDERLQSHGRSSETAARNSNGEARPPTEAPAKKSGGAKRLRWLKMRWKSSEQDECAVCLEQLKAAAPPLNLMQLPCGHRFHTNCLMPWLEANGHCPCCRMLIPSNSILKLIK